ncbi:hypothetical protein CPAR01_10748 [Colletotrichum paranaense]|uniref:DUF427 domain-containing protein n=6 Tax=Colletotrichum acutatum species complex TaxID=2707335 RepID=A0A9Q0B5C2_9PEZI|nr:uncharacterized protein CCOS01_01206 [Colletotrichum costaricense]XP_060347190.1 uncharacterized protein CPAR01_10748 [Colletotrichum paranaense]XP_060379978.1 uncharacterized protein CTAM01_09254 [Colletotrichum tamarilloi]XP_060396811.1 uncharacterized protein CABS01_12284 [Colletotrichum abscissum]KAI3543179.1 hypothetical protein CSPX01_06492 [Colletotrichum filicis]KAK0373842.1 hypothetical protein CLIM01_08791 [Colletotrichum limetticola]KAK1446438.1 hypothetical protein CMEL01_10681
MATRARMNVQTFPRPPLLEKISRHLRIVWNGLVIAETRDAYWVLETHHPPTYYLPPAALKVPLTPTRRSTYCEWKGGATYYTITAPKPSSGTLPEVISNRIWSYESPTPGFEAIKGYLSFYADPWSCFVDDEAVQPQPGDFYGGWVTSEIDGIVKGAHGNWDPVV